jgi:hypothetical protein
VVDLFAELQLPDTTIAHRWAIHLGSAAAAPAVAAPTPAIEAQRVAGAPPRQPIPPHRELGREEIAILVKRGGISLPVEIPLARVSRCSVPPNRRTPRQR